VDYAFKHVFGREATQPLLIDLLNSALNPGSGQEIRDIDLLNPFNPKEVLDDKLSILDIKARDQAGRQFNVEMQMLAFRYYEKRILYYWAKLHQQQMHEGQDYLELQPTLSISFLDHVLFPEVRERHHLRFRLLETDHCFPFTQDLELHLLELPKFRKAAGELSAGLDLWLYFLRHAEKMDTGVLSAALQVPPVPRAVEELRVSADHEKVDTAAFLAALQQHPQQPLVLRALEELMKLAQSDAERERYEARRKAQLDYNTGLKVARMEGREEGRAQGEVIGRIHLCERLLKRPLTPTEQLIDRALEELIHLADDLQAQVLKE
jgi:predicted transposase/invertase (TIGR01784 family)